jgi:hypothetical protein
VHYRQPLAIRDGIEGLTLGRNAALRRSTCTTYGPEHLRPEA